ncbi:OmpA family protein [Massilia sp. TN1-12]|uniref:OmpA family protein n=1 Tax=Massilia paldalensis TaxID=3377675 RepID=UPI00384EABCD
MHRFASLFAAALVATAPLLPAHAADHRESTERQAPSTATIRADGLLEAMKAEGRVPLYAIAFDDGKSTLKAGAKAQLKEVALALQKDPMLRVAIVGHTDTDIAADVDVEANTALSQRRAEAVVTALVKTYGVNGKRVVAHGAGSFAPVASNAEAEGRARNRRIELVLL